jgi:hypothetical protein
MNIRQKLPGGRQLVQVFAVASVMIYGWTTYRLIQKLPSWLFYLNAPEIFANYSHALVLNLLEVLLFVALIVLINLLLPAKLFMERFVARGSLFSIFSLGYLIYLALAIGQSKASQFPSEIFVWTPLVFLMILLSSVFLPQVEVIRKITEGFADRTVIFLYILLPLTGVGLLIFIFNNLS